MTIRRSLSRDAAVIARVTSSASSGARAGDRFELLVAKHDNHDEVRLHQPADGAQQEVGGHVVGEFGEQHDHRAPRQLRCERGQSERVIGFVGAVVDRCRKPLELDEGAAAGDEAACEPRPRNRTPEERPDRRASTPPTHSAASPRRSGRPARSRRPVRTSAVPYRWRRRSGCCARCGIAWRAASRAGPTASSRLPAGPCRCGNRPGRRSPNPRRGPTARSILRGHAARKCGHPHRAWAAGPAAPGMPLPVSPLPGARPSPADRSSATTAGRSARFHGGASPLQPDRLRVRPPAAPAAGRHSPLRPAARQAGPPMRSADRRRPPR